MGIETTVESGAGFEPAQPGCACLACSEAPPMCRHRFGGIVFVGYVFLSHRQSSIAALMALSDHPRNLSTATGDRFRTFTIDRRS